MNRYAVYYKTSRTVVRAATEHDAYQKVAVLFGIEPTHAHKACRASFLREDHNEKPATGVATTPNTMSKKKPAKTKKEDIGTKVARIIREDKAKKAAEKAATKPTKPTLADRVEKAAAPKPAPKAKAEMPAADPAKKLSGLDAAAEVLRTYKKPMTAKEVVGLMKEDGLWSSDAKTPEATIYAAMVTEIKKKGTEARFCKAERGKFIHAANQPD